MSPWLAVALVLAVLGGSMALLSAGAATEARRKLLHLEMGAVVLGFPWWFPAAWPVLVLAGAALAWFAAVRFSRRLAARFGPVLRADGRDSLGEVWFTLGVCLTFLLSEGDALAYSIAILVLTLADAAAALVGLRFGRQRRVPGGGSKSLAGCGAFFVVALTVVLLALWLVAGWPPLAALRAALLVAVITTLIEVLLAKGLDNLFVPLGALAALRLAA